MKYQNDSHFIKFKIKGKNFYKPEFFCFSSTINEVVPLLITDINRSEFAWKIYGKNRLLSNNLLIINNHPIKKVKIIGRIIAESIHIIGRTRKEFVLITLDDFSSSFSLQINVKVSKILYDEIGGDSKILYGRLTEVCGLIEEFYDFKEIYAESFSVFNDLENLKTEIEKWGEILKYRSKILTKPWVFSGKKKTDIKDNVSSNLIYDANSYSYASPLLTLIIRYILKFCFDSISKKALEQDDEIRHYMHQYAEENSHICSSFQSVSGSLNHQSCLFCSKVLDNALFELLKKCNLIRVTNSDKIILNNLKIIYKHLKLCLNNLRHQILHNNINQGLSINKYLEKAKKKKLLSHFVTPDLINTLIKYIIKSDLRNESNWIYKDNDFCWYYNKNDFIR